MPNPSLKDQIHGQAGAKGDREIFIFPVQLTTSKDKQPYPVDPSLAICDDYTHIHRLKIQGVTKASPC